MIGAWPPTPPLSPAQRYARVAVRVGAAVAVGIGGGRVIDRQVPAASGRQVLDILLIGVGLTLLGERGLTYRAHLKSLPAELDGPAAPTGPPVPAPEAAGEQRPRAPRG